MTLFWMSFCDPTLPTGEQFLGATIVEAEDSKAALRKSWRLGINPGGEVMFVELLGTAEMLPIQVQKYLHNLVSRDEAKADQRNEHLWEN